MNAHRPIDSKREDYRKYLERTGVLDVITKVLTQLYEEQDKVNDAPSFIYKFIGDSFPEKLQTSGNLENELAEERAKTLQLTEELDKVKKKLAALEQAQADAEKDEDAMLEDNPEAAPVPAPAVEPTSDAPPSAGPVAEDAPMDTCPPQTAIESIEDGLNGVAAPAVPTA